MQLKKILLLSFGFILFYLSCFAGGYTLKKIIIGNDFRPMILCLGDSITVGYGGTEPVISYRGPLQSLMGIARYHYVGSNYSSYNGSYELRHSAHGGDTTSDILSRLTVTELPSITFTPKSMVIIYCGVNDYYADTSATSRHNAVANVSSMIDEITAKDPDVSIYVGLIHYPTSGGSGWIASYNSELLTMMATKNKENLYSVDVLGAFNRNPEWTTDYLFDSVHPNDIGYQVMANTIYAEISQHL